MWLIEIIFSSQMAISKLLHSKVKIPKNVIISYIELHS